MKFVAAASVWSDVGNDDKLQIDFSWPNITLAMYVKLATYTKLLYEC